jgi:hypothetical protein
MIVDPRIDDVEPTSDHFGDDEDAATPVDEAMPTVGAAPDPAASGEDTGDAMRREAGADPAAADTASASLSMLLPTPD